MGNKLNKLILPGINFVLGVGVGTLDVLTSGYPLVWGFSESWRGINYFESRGIKQIFDISTKNYLSYVGSSLAGALIPFAIKYHNEISDFVEGVLK